MKELTLLYRCVCVCDSLPPSSCLAVPAARAMGGRQKTSTGYVMAKAPHSLWYNPRRAIYSAGLRVSRGRHFLGWMVRVCESVYLCALTCVCP